MAVDDAARVCGSRTQRLGADLRGSAGANRVTQVSLVRKYYPRGRIRVVRGARPKVELGVAVGEWACARGVVRILRPLRELTETVRERRQPISRPWRPRPKA